MRKIKVAHIITRLNVGGAQDIVLSMAGGLDKARFEVTLIAGPQDFSKEAVNRWGINITIVPDLIREINPIKDLKALVRLYFIIRKKGFDIVHTHTSKAGILGRVAAKLAGVPIIFNTPHGGIFHPIFGGPPAIFLLSRIEDLASRFTDRIIMCSDYERREFKKHGIASDGKYVTMYWGTAKEDSFLKTYDAASKRRELEIPDGVALIGNIARLVPQKGHLFCLEAFRALIERFPGPRLLIVGDGVLRPAIEAKINSLGLKESVIMTGYRDDVAEILAGMDISLHTSVWEGTPIAVVEAMLMAKPIVATTVGGIPELIEDGVTSILVPPYDKEALVEAVIRLLNDRPLAKRMGEAARRYAKEKFTLDAMVKNTTDLYNSYIESKIS